MPTTGTATYSIEEWDEKDIESFPDGSKWARSRVTQSYSGEITGSAVSESVLFYRPDGTSDFVTLERVDGAIGGRTGTVVFRHVGTYDGTVARSTFKVVPQSGTEGLTGMSGSGNFMADKAGLVEIDIEYEFDGDTA